MRIFKENGVEKVAATMRDPDPAIVVLKTDGTEVFIIHFSVIVILQLSPTYFVSNISNQHRWSTIFFFLVIFLG